MNRENPAMSWGFGLLAFILLVGESWDRLARSLVVRAREVLVRFAVAARQTALVQNGGPGWEALPCAASLPDFRLSPRSTLTLLC